MFYLMRINSSLVYLLNDKKQYIFKTEFPYRNVPLDFASCV